MSIFGLSNKTDSWGIPEANIHPFLAGAPALLAGIIGSIVEGDPSLALMGGLGATASAIPALYQGRKQAQEIALKEGEWGANKATLMDLGVPEAIAIAMAKSPEAFKLGYNSQVGRSSQNSMSELAGLLGFPDTMIPKVGQGQAPMYESIMPTFLSQLTDLGKFGMGMPTQSQYNAFVGGKTMPSNPSTLLEKFRNIMPPALLDPSIQRNNPNTMEGKTLGLANKEAGAMLPLKIQEKQGQVQAIQTTNQGLKDSMKADLQYKGAQTDALKSNAQTDLQNSQTASKSAEEDNKLKGAQVKALTQDQQRKNLLNTLLSSADKYFPSNLRPKANLLHKAKAYLNYDPKAGADYLQGIGYTNINQLEKEAQLENNNLFKNNQPPQPSMWERIKQGVQNPPQVPMGGQGLLNPASRGVGLGLMRR